VSAEGSEPLRWCSTASRRVPNPKNPSTVIMHRWIFASAGTVGAHVLVTGNEDLLSIAGESAIRIASPRASGNSSAPGQRHWA
jgi:hypothetical protein